MNAAEYARHRGISRMRVSQYISLGKISATKVGRGYEIDPAVADQELNGSVDARQPATKVVRKPKEPPPAPIDSSKPLVASKPIAEPMKGGPTYAEAQRAREVYRAERERLKLLQEKGELVQAADVKKEVMTLTRTIRDNMLGIPGRVASQAAASRSVHEVRRLLEDEISTALRMLANG